MSIAILFSRFYVFFRILTEKALITGLGETPVDRSSSLTAGMSLVLSQHALTA